MRNRKGFVCRQPTCTQRVEDWISLQCLTDAMGLNSEHKLDNWMFLPMARKAGGTERVSVEPLGLGSSPRGHYFVPVETL